MASDEQSGYTRFDETRWPIVVAIAPRTPLAGAAFDEHCRRAFGYFEREQPFALVFDTRGAAPLTADQRRTIAEATDKHRLLYPKAKLIVAVIVASALQRGIVKAITWLTQQPVPTQVFGTVEEGIAWASRVLKTGEQVGAG